MARGWTAPAGDTPTADDILDHIDLIRDQDGYTVPESIADELKIVIESVKRA